MAILVTIEGYVQGVSSTSTNISTGSKRFILSREEPFKVGMQVEVNDGTENNIMVGTVQEYNSTTLNLVISVSTTTGAGTYNNWVIGGVRNFYFSDCGYTTKPSDSPANTLFVGNLEDPGNFEQHLFSPGSTYGESSVSKGEIVIQNTGGHDYLAKVGFNKRNLTIEKISGGTYANAVFLFRGTMEQVSYSWNRLYIRMRDRLADLDTPVQSSVFSGTNTGASGIEGSTGDIKGYVKPVLLGSVENVSLVSLNTSTQVYGCNFDKDGNPKPVYRFDAVYDNGILLDFYQNYTDLTALLTATIPAGYYGTCVDAGLIRLESSAAGTVTADIVQGDTAAQRTSGQLVKILLEEYGGYSASDYVEDDIDYLDSLNTSVCGIYITDSTTLLNAIMQLLNSIGGTVYLTSDRKFAFDILQIPDSEESVATITKEQLLAIDRVISRDEGNGIPAKQTKIHYRLNYTLQTASEVSGAVTDERRTFIENEYRSDVTAENLAVKTKHPNAPVLEFHTLLTNASNASTENARRNAIYTVERDWYRLRVSTNNTDIYNINDVVTIQLPRFGLDSGKKFRIMGRVLYFSKNYVEYMVWG